MSASRWTAADVPEQNGRTAVITGSNSGIGYEAAAVQSSPRSHDTDLAQRLWTVSEDLTGVTFPI